MKHKIITIVLLTLPYYANAENEKPKPNPILNQVPYGYYVDKKRPPVYFQDRLKFGFQLGTDIRLIWARYKRGRYGGLFLAKLPGGLFDIFGEYRTESRRWGIRANLGIRFGSIKARALKTKKILYFNALIPLKYYPGSGRQFCFLLGPEMYFILLSLDVKSKNTKELYSTNINCALGIEYQLKIGLFFGHYWSISIADFTEKPRRKLKGYSDNIIVSSTYIGYDFAPLL